MYLKWETTLLRRLQVYCFREVGGVGISCFPNMLMFYSVIILENFPCLLYGLLKYPICDLNCLQSRWKYVVHKSAPFIKHFWWKDQTVVKSLKRNVISEVAVNSAVRWVVLQWCRYFWCSFSYYESLLLKCRWSAWVSIWWSYVHIEGRVYTQFCGLPSWALICYWCRQVANWWGQSSLCCMLWRLSSQLSFFGWCFIF